MTMCEGDKEGSWESKEGGGNKKGLSAGSETSLELHGPAGIIMLLRRWGRDLQAGGTAGVVAWMPRGSLGLPMQS